MFVDIPKYCPNNIVRVTGDCPIIDPQLVDEVINKYNKHAVDYISNTDPPTYPDGLDVEIFSFSALETAYKKAKTTIDCEHVTPFIRNGNAFKRMNYENEIDYSKERWTLDDPEDYEVIKNILNHFAPNEDFSSYPRMLDQDINKLRSLNIDILFIPSEDEIYNNNSPDIIYDRR